MIIKLSAQDLKSNQYTTILNTVLQNITDLETLAMYAYLQSLPPNHNVNKAYLQERFKIGQRKINAIFATLAKHNLITYDKEHCAKQKIYKKIHITVNNGTNFTHIQESSAKTASKKLSTGSKPITTEPEPTYPQEQNLHVQKATRAESNTCRKRMPIEIKYNNNINNNNIYNINNNTQDNKNTNKKQKYNTPLPPAKSKSAGVREVGVFDDDVLHDRLEKALKAYSDYRHERKRKLTQSSYTAARHRLEELQAQGHDAEAVVMQTIRNGWQDLYPLKQQSKPKETTVERAKRVFSLI